MNTPSKAAIENSARRVQDTLLHARFEAMLQRWGEDTPLRTNLHASSVLVPATEWCSRSHILVNIHPNEAEPPEANNARLNAIYLHGWYIHRKWQLLLKKYGRVVYRGHEPCLDLEHHHYGYDISYSPDAILEDKNGKWCPLEIKGINTDEYRAACDLPLEKAVLKSETTKKARVQVTLYMHLLGVQQGLILIEDKNTQAFTVWSLTYDEALIKPYLERLNKYAEEKRAYIVDAILPGRHKLCKSVDSARARRCPMASFCFEKEAGA